MSNNIKAIQLALLSTAFFTIANAMIKMATSDFHVFQIIIFRQSIILLATMPAIIRTWPNTLKTKRPLAHIVRLSGASTGMIGGMIAVSGLPLATATTLGFAKIMFLAILAFLFLKESLGPHRVGAIIVGFLGVLLVMRPDVDGMINPYTLVAVLAAVGSAVASASVRSLTRTDSTETLLAYQALAIGILAAIPLYWVWQQPDWQGLLFLISIGLVSTIAQWLGIVSYRYGEASLVGSIDYMNLVYASFLGYFIFSEIPDKQTIAGAVLIIGASAYIMHREALNKKRKRLEERP
ncbi:DMT family transporter [uncultured Cohaesibacter sp.]|uniref:DMT family transporter n=1 Tax=uncultured Cohaesibacter sp. TaxID=1002546 RepID=UPI00292F0A87|nr:DMT family transporter [uncultured Cohaesibacter sp.]